MTFDEAWEAGRAEREAILARMMYEADLLQWWPSDVIRPSDGWWERLEEGFDRAWSARDAAKRAVQQARYDIQFNEIARRFNDDPGEGV